MFCQIVDGIVVLWYSLFEKNELILSFLTKQGDSCKKCRDLAGKRSKDANQQ